MICVKCKKEIADGSLYCNFCGKKQSYVPAKYHKRAHGTGSIRRNKRYKKEWLAYAPSDKFGRNRHYVGAYATRKEAQEALAKYLEKERPELYNATLQEVYALWSETHYKRVSQSAINLYSAMWKRFAPLYSMKIREIKTAHLQEIVNTGTSKSACDAIRALATMLCRFAVENDIVDKNYAEFIKMPKFEKKEKRIFSREEIALLWEHTDDKNVQVILLMIYTGFRIGEITALTADNINLKDGYIIGGEKTEAGKNRIVPLPPNIPELKEFLKRWINSTPTGERFFPVTNNTFRLTTFRNGLKVCGITDKRLTPHSTRHTFASLSAAAGMQPENLQKIIGHASFSTTAEIYIHQDFETLQAEMSKIKK